MASPLMEWNEFCLEIEKDFKKRFPIVRIENNYLYVEIPPRNVSIPINTIYNEYCYLQDYNQVLETYFRIAHQILDNNKFEINYKNVFPTLKHESFGMDDPQFKFYRKPLFADIHMLFVSDEGEMFRYVLETDDFEKEKLEIAAMKNLNKISNLLVRIDANYDIYTLYYATDYGASLLLTNSLQKQIFKLVGKNYIFGIPSTTSLIVAKDNPVNIDIVKKLILLDEDPNKISNNVYRYKDGTYSIIKDSKSIVKAMK